MAILVSTSENCLKYRKKGQKHYFFLDGSDLVQMVYYSTYLKRNIKNKKREGSFIRLIIFLFFKKRKIVIVS